MPNTMSAALSISGVITEILTGDRDGDLSLMPAALRNYRVSKQSDSGGAVIAYRDVRTGVASSQTVDYDLIGTLTDAAGNTLSFDLVFLIVLVNTSASSLTSPILIGPKASSSLTTGPWADASDRSRANHSNGIVWLYNPSGWAVSAGSDIFSVETPGSGSGYSWDIAILGKDNA
jgi:hypothetical protein